MGLFPCVPLANRLNEYSLIFAGLTGESFWAAKAGSLIDECKEGL